MKYITAKETPNAERPSCSGICVQALHFGGGFVGARGEWLSLWSNGKDETERSEREDAWLQKVGSDGKMEGKKKETKAEGRLQQQQREWIEERGLLQSLAWTLKSLGESSLRRVWCQGASTPRHTGTTIVVSITEWHASSLNAAQQHKFTSTFKNSMVKRYKTAKPCRKLSSMMLTEYKRKQKTEPLQECSLKAFRKDKKKLQENKPQLILFESMLLQTFSRPIMWQRRNSFTLLGQLLKSKLNKEKVIWEAFECLRVLHKLLIYWDFPKQQ